jgi:hypothetical protein
MMTLLEKLLFSSYRLDCTHCNDPLKLIYVQELK